MSRIPVVLVRIDVPEAVLGAAWDSERAWDDEYAWDDALFVTDGGTTSLWFSDGRYVSTADGIVASARLANEIAFSRRATTVFWGGGRAAQGMGAIELINTDGALDGLLSMRWRRAVVTVFLGYDGDAVASLTRAARGVIERVESVGEQSLRIVVADAASELDVPFLTATYTTGELAGTLIPCVLGYCVSIPALYTGAPTLTYSIHEGGTWLVDALTFRHAVYDEGAALTPSTQWTALDSGEQHGFTLLQSTAGTITADATGPSSNGNVFSARTLYYIVEYALCTRRGWDSSRVDFAGITSLQAELGTTWFGRWISGSTTYAELLTELADSFGGWCYIDTAGQVRFDRLRMPAGSPALALDETNIVGEIQIEFDTAPGLSDAVLGMRNWYVFDASALAGSVRDTATGVALRKPFRTRAQFTVDDAYASRRSAAPAVRRTLQNDARQTTTTEPESGMPTSLMAVGHVSAEAARRAALYAGPRWWYRVRAVLAATEAATLERGSIIRLTAPRHGLDAGRLLVVIGVDGRVGDGIVDLLLWGDGPAI